MTGRLLDEALGLKALARAGWARVGATDVESVAAHSWGLAWLVLALCPSDLDRGRALAYATIHDLAEVRAGDLTPTDCSPEEKRQREEAAAAGLLASRPDLLSLWRAYEAQADAESRFVRQLDRLDMALQAARYHREQGIDATGFLASAGRIIDAPALRVHYEAACAAVGVAPTPAVTTPRAPSSPG